MPGSPQHQLPTSSWNEKAFERLLSRARVQASWLSHIVRGRKVIKELTCSLQMGI